MHTLLIAIDCWESMPDEQIMRIVSVPATQHISQVHGFRPHRLLPRWPEWTDKQIAKWIKDHPRECRLVYVGQHWQECMHNRPTGIRIMSMFKHWCRIQVIPSLCRIDSDSTDRVLRGSDLDSTWHCVQPDLYQLS